jgi:hypothetical protein
MPHREKPPLQDKSSGAPFMTVPLSWGRRTAAPRTAALLLFALATAPAHSQTASEPATPPPEEHFSGCVQGLPGDKNMLVISSDTVCAKLTGKFTAADLSGHEVDLKGILTERTPANPASLKVTSVVTIGKSCSSTCSLQPPGTRSLGKGGEKPGKEGGTPGAAPTPVPPPQ